MATENVTVAISEEGSGGNKLVQTLRNLSDTANKAAVSVDRSAESTRRSGAAATKAAADNTLLSRSLGGVQNGYGLLSAAIGGFLGKLSLEKLTGYADTYTNIRNKLQLVTPTQLATNKAMDESFRIAQLTRTSWETTATTYGKLTGQLQAMGKPLTDANRLTETIAKSLAVSGTSAEEAKNGLRQFNQGFDEGALRGENFNSVLESVPGLAKAIAEGLKVPTGQLRAMAEQGKLTNAVLVDALSKAAKSVDKAFAASAPTVAQAWQTIENAAIKYVGTTNNAYSATGLMTSAMMGLANNMNIVAPIMAGLVATMVLMAGVALAQALYSMVAGFVALTTAAVGAAIALGTTFALPLAAIGVAIVAAIGVLKAFGISFSDVANKILDLASAIPGLKDTVDNLRKSFKGSEEGFKGYASAADVANASTKIFNKEGKLVGAVIDGVRVELDKTNPSFGNFRNNLDGSAKSAGNAAGATKELSNALRMVKEDLNQHGEKIDEVRKAEFDYYAGLRKLNEEYERKSAEEFDARVKALNDTLDDGVRSFESYYGLVKKTNSEMDLGSSSNDNYTSSLRRQAAAYDTVAESAQRAQRTRTAYFSSVNDGFKGIGDDIGAALGDVSGRNPSGGGGSQTTGMFDIVTGYEFKYNGASLLSVLYPGNYGAGLDPGTGMIWREAKVQDLARQIEKIPAGVDPAAVKSALLLAARSGGQIGDYLYAANKTKDKSNGQIGGSGFAMGGSFVVDGQPGTDTNLVQFYASRGEEVSIATPRSVRKGLNDNSSEPTSTRQDRRAIQVRIYAQDADSFRRTTKQTAQDAKRLIQKAGG